MQLRNVTGCSMRIKGGGNQHALSKGLFAASSRETWILSAVTPRGLWGTSNIYSDGLLPHLHP